MRSEISICPVSEDKNASYHLIFFITGNPGLIGYYDTYLSTLHQLLSMQHGTQSSSNVFHVYGQNLAGFSDDIKEAWPKDPPYNLEQQIQLLMESVKSRRIPIGPRLGQSYDNIILIGHSVGAYILLEILSRLRQSLPEQERIIKAGILLFPTVTHIAKSASGRNISLLFRIPEFPRIAALLARALVWPVPRSALQWLVGVVTKMPTEAAEVTTDFLVSRLGVHQALHLAKHEMKEITEDRWDKDIWAIEDPLASSKSSIPKLIFYFGKEDHWVSSQTRDELIAVRGRKDGLTEPSNPVFLIDENGIDHGFCIHHSEAVAEKTRVWIEEILS